MVLKLVSTLSLVLQICYHPAKLDNKKAWSQTEATDPVHHYTAQPGRRQTDRSHRPGPPPHRTEATGSVSTTTLSKYVMEEKWKQSSSVAVKRGGTGDKTG